ncbi:von Willebrand factor type A domain-containing protein [Pedobacter sp. P351]|uniref:vWA domain-containing protein n=1 Tax=Pedobacter superstes TaxID=3133441 RepID=UPI0030A75E21
MKRILFSIILLFVVFTLQAQKITGIVTDAKDKQPLIGATVNVKNSTISTATNSNGKYSIKLTVDNAVLVFSYIGYKSKEVKIGKDTIINVSLNPSNSTLEEAVVIGYGTEKKDLTGSVAGVMNQSSAKLYIRGGAADFNTESYNGINENRFFQARQTPLSTFGIDVDAASYSNVRRYINNGNLPPVDAVRIEEMINYFSYEYPQPQNNDPFSVNTEISSAPWNHQHRLVRIGLQGKKIPLTNLPASNLVFLIDVSGSMNQANKLPLVKSSIKLLVDQLREKDKVSIVVYAGAAGLVLPATSGERKQTIKNALDALQAGGSTAGGAGIKLAYKIAMENIVKGGNNRVILASDGDFNIGVSSDGEMQRLIEDKKKSGIFLTVLGYGMGNYKDSKMETLADKGNGNYAYIDNITEARKVLVNEFGGTLFTIAKDVKLQIEFNPKKVQYYRLIGYENRLLNKEDFNNDKKDAGDLGSGHSVTALYEIIPVGVKSKFKESVDDLKYQNNSTDIKTPYGNELFTVKLRYKTPTGNTSKLIEKSVLDKNIDWDKTSKDFKFSAAVAGYGMLLRDSEFLQETNYPKVISWAKSGLGDDEEGYRNEFVQLVKSSALLPKEKSSSAMKPLDSN